ncbi:EamA family transporter [Chelatococcus sp. GCM10030263]|uniref:EamA family transporter n=1 Tax=Chelatococcus sp. GCM10030263 TaxID=3273387 RepID=UPI003613BDEA
MTSSLAFVLTLSSAFAALGQVLLKVGATDRTTLMSFVNGYVALGLAAYGGGVLLWLYGLSRVPLFLVYPFTLLTFVLVGLASIIWFGERPAPISVVGWLTIIVGLVLVYLGAES